jgi:hypothetical protein
VSAGQAGVVSFDVDLAADGGCSCCCSRWWRTGRAGRCRWERTCGSWSTDPRRWRPGRCTWCERLSACDSPDVTLDGVREGPSTRRGSGADLGDQTPRGPPLGPGPVSGKLDPRPACSVLDTRATRSGVTSRARVAAGERDVTTALQGRTRRCAWRFPPASAPGSRRDGGRRPPDRTAAPAAGVRGPTDATPFEDGPPDYGGDAEDLQHRSSTCLLVREARFRGGCRVDCPPRVGDRISLLLDRAEHRRLHQTGPRASRQNRGPPAVSGVQSRAGVSEVNVCTTGARRGPRCRPARPWRKGWPELIVAGGLCSGQGAFRCAGCRGS